MKPITDKIIVSGPCSAESREQVLQTAEGLAAQGVTAFRAGLWKPRTRPGCFEGVGAEGLEWLAEARNAYGMRIATELNTARNADLLLKAGVDIVWIGARTATNPFDVQDIANALRGCHIDVYVKNPVAPDPALWLGAIERIERAGIKGRIVAIHRGFCTWEKDIFRNNPIWSIPMQLKAQRPDVPVVCDPSHIAGQAELVPHVARMAISLGMDGLFVESHCNPSAALSDAAQQLTPDEAGRMFRNLKLTE
ncbi:hypothetical protein [uncultured Rikenella sp.]|uniref:hypothetical protein n=1 Tax=uncultured Rikenella sp. TaxID=368003 RepID=UPI00262E5759|nr:hypothetical protein [uncultured Rikenella sp.]